MNTVISEFKKTVHANPSKPAIYFRSNFDYSILSYLQLYRIAIFFADNLKRSGISHGKNVAIIMNNQPEWMIAFLALQVRGCVAVPIDHKLESREIKRLLDHSDVDAIITLEKAYSVFKSANVLAKTVIFMDTVIKDGISRTNADIKEPDTYNSDTAVIFYTSGTTAAPKGVKLSNANLLANVRSIKKMKIARKSDIFISMLPLHHTYSFMVTGLVPLLNGSSISYPYNISSEDITECSKKTKVTVFTGVPQVFLLLHRLINEKISQKPLFVQFVISQLMDIAWVIRRITGINLARVIFSKIHRQIGESIRLMVSGGAKLDAGTIRDFFKWGFTVLEGYGITETSPVISLNPISRPVIGSVGKALPDIQVKVVNPDDSGVGELYVKGENVMLGYYGQDEETKKVIIDGWYTTGDSGFIDKNGYIFITGRTDELLVLTSGEKVVPEALEKVYEKSPYIDEACIFSIDRAGFIGTSKSLVGVIVIDEDKMQNHEIGDIEEMIKNELEGISQKLVSYKRITGFLVVKGPLPRTALGKLRRNKIIKRYSDEFHKLEHKKVSVLRDEYDIEFSSGIYKDLLEYLSKKLERQVSVNDHLEMDLGLDSLSRVELLFELQQYLHLEISDSKATEIVSSYTVRDVFIKLSHLLNNKD